MKKVYRVAVVGYGGMGAYHAEQLARTPEFEIAGVFDIDPAREKAAEKTGLLAYPSFAAVLEDAGVDAVLIATPNDSHADYAVAAARAGKHVICEKPIACTLEEAERMCAAAEKAGTVLMVHQNRRWDEDYLTVREIVKSGVIGGVYELQSRVLGSHGIPGDWRKIAAQGGGMMLDWGVHLIDQLLKLVPGKIVRIFCDCSYVYGEEVDDGFQLMLWFDSDVKAEVVVDTNTFRSLPRWFVLGTEGSAEIADWELHGGITRVKRRKDEKLAGIKAGNGFTRTMAPRSGETVEELALPAARAPEFAFYRSFLSAVEGGEKVIADCEVLRVFRIMEAALTAAKQEKIIEGEW